MVHQLLVEIMALCLLGIDAVYSWAEVPEACIPQIVAQEDARTVVVEVVVLDDMAAARRDNQILVVGVIDQALSGIEEGITDRQIEKGMEAVVCLQEIVRGWTLVEMLQMMVVLISEAVQDLTGETLPV